ncbi:MAG TPA: hypothetical protein DD735_07240 [Clostridiales bacterium]|nr:hypothetical protein [Clostridiales bacterium]
MPDNRSSPGELIAALKEMLKAGGALFRFTRDQYGVLTGDDESGIMEALGEREQIIAVLMNLDNKIDSLLEEAGLRRDALPPDAEALRLDIRSALGAVTEIDIAVITHISGRLQKYKDLTIKARNQRHISAYLKSDIAYRENSLDLRQ